MFPPAVQWVPQASISSEQGGFSSCAGAFPVPELPVRSGISFPWSSGRCCEVTKSLLSHPCHVLLRTVIWTWKQLPNVGVCFKSKTASGALLFGGQEELGSGASALVLDPFFPG